LGPPPPLPRGLTTFVVVALLVTLTEPPVKIDRSIAAKEQKHDKHIGRELRKDNLLKRQNQTRSGGGGMYIVIWVPGARSAAKHVNQDGSPRRIFDNGRTQHGS
ncbi:unnamed protein product, partial [Ectocarpus fasciculatus]